jgi:hypothetical protein
MKYKKIDLITSFLNDWLLPVNYWDKYSLLAIELFDNQFDLFIRTKHKALA